MPKGWRGKLQFECWGWSERDLAEAQKMARAKADRIAAHLRATQKRPDRYGYGTRPLREQALRRFTGPDGKLTAAISRNQYGCLVLNTATAMFVDIDIEELESPQKTSFSFFRKPKPVSEDFLVQPHLERVRRWTVLNPDWSWRVYRTRAGLRLLATHAEIPPAAADPTFQALGADPLYQKLCANQKSYRARLTPKPWRIGHYHNRIKWPWPNDRAEAAFNRWDQTYLEKSARFATCRFLETVGSGATHPAIAPLIELHDQSTRAQEALELA